jgi:hypothetical protein
LYKSSYLQLRLTFDSFSNLHVEEKKLNEEHVEPTFLLKLFFKKKIERRTCRTNIQYIIDIFVMIDFISSLRSKKFILHNVVKIWSGCGLDNIYISYISVMSLSRFIFFWKIMMWLLRKKMQGRYKGWPWVSSLIFFKNNYDVITSGKKIKVVTRGDPGLASSLVK